MQQLRARARAVAACDVCTLVVGPSGSGKEVVARAIHALSRRRAASFVAVNCAALPHDLVESDLFGHERGAFTGAGDRHRGVFELANHGTVFLDEIVELAPAAQAKLLRVLQDFRFRRVGGETEVAVDVRILAATNQDLRQRVRAGCFREDLFHRLDVVTITAPALIERREDIPELVAHFLNELGAPHCALTASALQQLQDHPWPGNLRELRNVIERALVFDSGPWIESVDLGPPNPTDDPLPDPSIPAAIRNLSAAFAGTVRAGMPAPRLLHTIEGALAETALALAAGNKTAAARWLGMDRKALSRRVQRRDSAT